MSSIKFPFMVIPTKHMSTMSSIKISFYGNPHSTCVTYIIHTSCGGLCESPSLQVNYTNCGVNAHTRLDKVHSCVTTWVRTTGMVARATSISKRGTQLICLSCLLILIHDSSLPFRSPKLPDCLTYVIQNNGEKW